MHPLQRGFFRRFTLSMIVIFSLVAVPYCICGLFLSNSYAAQSDNEAVAPDEEQVVAEAAQENSQVASDTAKDDKTKDTKTKDDKSKESASVATMSTMSGTGG